jgi:hypothetical protein
MKIEEIIKKRILIYTKLIVSNKQTKALNEKASKRWFALPVSRKLYEEFAFNNEVQIDLYKSQIDELKLILIELTHQTKE